MKSIEQLRSHRLETEEPTSASAAIPMPVARKIARKASAGAEPAAMPVVDGRWGFGDAVNAGLIQRHGDGDIAAGAELAVARAGGGGGAPLPDTLREKFETSLDADLSGVRVHTDDAAAHAASSLGAQAYALGQDVYMGAGRYAPETSEGAMLLAHEVAHTVQQADGPRCKLEVTEAGDASEREADDAAAAMVRGAPARVSGSAALARKVQLQRGAGTHQDIPIGAHTQSVDANVPTVVAWLNDALHQRGTGRAPNPGNDHRAEPGGFDLTMSAAMTQLRQEVRGLSRNQTPVPIDVNEDLGRIGRLTGRIELQIFDAAQDGEIGALQVNRQEGSNRTNDNESTRSHRREDTQAGSETLAANLNVSGGYVPSEVTGGPTASMGGGVNSQRTAENRHVDETSDGHRDRTERQVTGSNQVRGVVNHRPMRAALVAIIRLSLAPRTHTARSDSMTLAPGNDIAMEETATLGPIPIRGDVTFGAYSYAMPSGLRTDGGNVGD